MNDCLGTNYNPNRLSEWGKGRAVPDYVRAYMMRKVLPSLLTEICSLNVLNQRQVELIIANLMPLK